MSKKKDHENLFGTKANFQAIVSKKKEEGQGCQDTLGSLPEKTTGGVRKHWQTLFCNSENILRHKNNHKICGKNLATYLAIYIFGNVLVYIG